MILLEDLIDAYYATRKNKRRSADSVEFELHWLRNILQLFNNINNRTLKPTAYTFITLKPRPREIFACEMMLRVIHHYIDIRIRPLIENKLTDRTFNNRKGYGQSAAIQKVYDDIKEVTNNYTEDAWIIKLDIKGYFPNANKNIVCKQLQDLVKEKYFASDKDDLLWMIKICIYSNPLKHCYHKSPIWMWNLIDKEKSLFYKPDHIGGAIGHLIWQNAMNYYLDEIDHWILELLHLHYVRFVDDMIFITTDKNKFLLIIPTLREKLKYYGCLLHPSKFYCQHYTKGVEFIGSYIKINRIYITNRTLKAAKNKINNFNKCVRENKLASFLASINSYIGIMKHKTEYANIRLLITYIVDAWFKYINYSDIRRCIVANEGYKFNDILIRKYNIKTKIYGKRKC